jgi:nudix-type nucleoside diphosphatase (YffH/AdpP family)
MEEAGVEVDDLKEVFHCFMSPGAVTERMHLFVGTYSEKSRAAKGGGLADEGEDIAVLEMPLNDAVAMVANGEIVDVKTIALLQWAQIQQLTK